jgi:Calx-beta domain/Bacterial Ig domain/PKD domain
MTAATACSRLRSLLRLALLVCASLVAAEVQAATPPATWTTGHKKVLIIPVRFTDQIGPSDVPNAQGYRSGWGEMTNGTTAAALNAFFQRSSYGKLSMEFTVLPEINLGVSYTVYNATYGTSGFSKFAAWEEPGSFADDVRSKARQVGIAAGQAALYDSDNYDLDFLFCGFIPGQGTLASGRAHGKGVFGTTSLALAHEFGHNFGLAHANGISRSTFHSQLKSGTFFTDPYGDVFDLMGWKNTAPVPLVPDRDVNPFWKWQMGWLPDANIATPAVSGTYRIHAFDQPALEAGKNYALRVVRDPSRVYWFSYRASITNEESLWSNNGLEVRIGGESVPATGGHTTLFDMTPGSRGLANIPSVTNNPYATLYDAPLAIGRTYSDNEANLHVTPVKKAGTAPESLDVVLNYGPFPGNSAPTASISPATLTLAAGVAQTFTATASDANGDTLAYYWEFDDPDALGGTAAGNTNPDARLSTQGSHTWTRSGTFLARCTVTDMKGGKTIASATLTITGGMTALRTITGVVKDENGNPLAGAVVNNYKGSNPNFVRYGATNFVGASETAADGKYVVHVPTGITGTFYLNVLHQGFSFTNSAAGGAVGVYSASVANVDFNRVRTNRTVSGGIYIAGRGYNPATDGTLTVNVNGQNIATAGGGWSTTVADGTPLNITPTAVFGMFPNPYVAVDDFNLLHLFLNVAGQMPQVGFTSSGATSDDTVGTVNIPVTLALPPGSNSWPANQFLVYWLDPSGTAEYGVDYKAAGGSINFTGGQVPTPYLIPLKLLPTGEPKNKTVVIKLGPASSIVNMGPITTFTYTITNAPAPPPNAGVIQFAQASYSVAESAGTVTLVATRTGSSSGSASGYYRTANGTATAGQDYTPTTNFVTWLDGDTANKNVILTILNDAVVESAETFTVMFFTNTVGSTLGAQSTATVTLLDDDAPPVSTVPNRRPQAQPQCLLVVLNTATPISLAGRDGDGDPLTYRITVAPTRGGLSGTAPNLTYTPNNNVSGPDYFCFVANDGKTDSQPAVVTLAINSSANTPPVVTLLTPATHSWFVRPTNLVLTATASDTDGIYAVEFYEGTNALAQLFTPPFTFTWTNPPPGTYTLLAKAYDAGGRRGLSAPATIRVLDAMPLVNVRPTGGMFQVAWPLGVSGAVLEESTNLRQWSLVTNAVVDTATERTHSFTPGPGRYFRFSVW